MDWTWFVAALKALFSPGYTSLSIPELENQLNHLQFWLMIWTLVVAAGLVIEYAIPATNFSRDLCKWIQQGTAPVLETAAVCAGVGAFLITVGVIGEGLIESWQSPIERSLSKANSTTRASLEAELKRARSIADSAVAQANLAKQGADDASNKTKRLDTQLSSVKQRADDLSGKLTDALGQVEDANRARLKLQVELINVEVCSSPRVLPNWSASGKTSADPLKGLAGATVIIEYVADNEAQRAASNIVGALKFANLNVRVNPVKAVNEINDGVEVQPYVGPIGGTDIQNSRRADDVADVLVKFLHLYNWQAQRRFPLDTTRKLIRDDSVLPPGSVRIQVGLYPAVMYIPPKELSGALAKFRADWKKGEEESRRSKEEYMRKMFASLPPDQRIIAEQGQKEFDERMKKEMSKGDNPCKDFTHMADAESPPK
jgi:hypothetical protein